VKKISLSKNNCSSDELERKQNAILSIFVKLVCNKLFNSVFVELKEYTIGSVEELTEL
jgi:tryptophan-rich sensory protein